MGLHIISGPPAAGKTTFLNNNAKPGDIRIDLDHITNLITGQDLDNHTHHPAAFAIAKAARRAAIDTALQHVDSHEVWIIDSHPGGAQLARYQQAGAQMHILAPPKDVVMKRIKASNRPSEMLKVAANWYTQQQSDIPRRNTTDRGYGWKQQKTRELLMAAHRDGSPCWWCGLPMYRRKDKNWDGMALAADHSNPGGAQRGERPDRLLHGRCNSQAKDHSNDDRRPALTGRHPSEPLASREEVETVRSRFNFGPLNAKR